MIKSFILAAFLAASLSFAQVSSIPSTAGGGASTFDNVGSGTNTTATLTCGSGCTLVTTAGVFRLPNGTSAPGTCTVGDAFFDTDATAGRNFYGCTATNTWTLLGAELTDCSETSGTMTCPSGFSAGTGSTAGAIELKDADGSAGVTIKAQDVMSASYTLKPPDGAPAAGQVQVQGTPSAGVSLATWALPLLANAVNANGYVDWTLGSAPGNPASGDIRLYPKTGSTLCARDSAGTETCYGAGGGGGSTTYSGNYSSLSGQSCTTGDTYLFEDAAIYNFARCTATDTWGKIYADGKTVTLPPASGSFTTVTTGSSGTCALANDSGALTIKCDSATTDKSDVYLTALPGGNTWTQVFGFRMGCTGGDYCGLLFGTSTTNTNASGNQRVINMYTNTTTFAQTMDVSSHASWAYVTGLTSQRFGSYPLSYLYVKIAQTSGGNRVWSYSIDRKIWITFLTESATNDSYYYFRFSGLGAATIFHWDVQ